jgi:hypothetical protein
MANKRITDLQAKTLPYAGGEVGVVDDGTTTYRADLRYWGLANAAMTWPRHADPRPTSQTGSRRRAVPLLRSGEPVR